MHGVKRARQSPEAIRMRKEKERTKLDEYLNLTKDALSRRKSGDWSDNALKLTTRLLNVNPEFYTIWNYRRNILSNGIFPACSPDAINELLSEDLAMTIAFLKKYPKVYWIWNHRRWCLEHVPEGPADDPVGWRKANWSKELFVVEKMLDVDARNFLAWAYRRYVLASMPERQPLVKELAYTTRKIEANFSNFSAWHQRSRIYSVMWDKDPIDTKQIKEGEFELVKQAIYVDPADQSAWIYHRWLIGPGDDKQVLQREIVVIEELLALEPDSKWCLESLVHYKRLLSRSHLSGDEEIATLKQCVQMLQRLSVIDSQRKRRYAELEADCVRSMSE